MRFYWKTEAASVTQAGHANFFKKKQEQVNSAHTHIHYSDTAAAWKADVENQFPSMYTFAYV